MKIYRLEFWYCCSWIFRGFFATKKRAEEASEAVAMELSQPLLDEHVKISEVEVTE